jgi:hypothetical protein
MTVWHSNREDHFEKIRGKENLPVWLVARCELVDTSKSSYQPQ